MNFFNPTPYTIELIISSDEVHTLLTACHESMTSWELRPRHKVDCTPLTPQFRFLAEMIPQLRNALALMSHELHPETPHPPAPGPLAP